ncbi:hypothetical protein GCM10020256_06360 [Streptomyces thermocoprophilus]
MWNRDLSAYDPDGPLPDIDPDVESEHLARGRAQVHMYRDPIATAREWRELAEANNWSIRDLVINTGNRQNFVGSPETIAKTIDAYVQADAADGFILVPHITPRRPRRVRRQGRPAPPGTGRLPHRLRGHHPARPPGPEPARVGQSRARGPTGPKP